MDEYTIIEDLGRGTFGEVYKASNNNNGKIYAIKEIKLVNEEAIYDAKREYNILKYIQRKLNCSKYILCVEEFKESSNNFYIITEYLYSYITLNKINDVFREVLTTENYNTIFENLCCGLKLLHSIGIVHRDIKSDNVLINLITLNIKYIDFGLADTRSNFDGLSIIGTKNYLHINLYSVDEITFKILKNADIWALGILIYYVIYGYTPLEKYIEITKNNYTEEEVGRNREMFFYLKYREDFSYKKTIGTIKKLDEVNEYRKNNDLNLIELEKLLSLNINKNPVYYCENCS